MGVYLIFAWWKEGDSFCGVCRKQMGGWFRLSVPISRKAMLYISVSL